MKVIKELYSYREMIFSLVRKDLRGRYKGSVLGFLWTFVNPLLQLAVYSFVFAFILRADIDKFYLFLFVALIPWLFFSSCITSGSFCILGEKGLITKIYFPREVLPIAWVTSAFVNMLLCFLVVFAVVLFSGAHVNFAVWLFLIPVAFIEYLLALGFTLIFSAATVYFRDLQHILGILSMAWMYFTPVVYPEEIIPEQFRAMFSLNPMTPIIRAYRDILYYARIPDMFTLLSALACGVIGVFVGFFVFNKLKRGFAEEM